MQEDNYILDIQKDIIFEFLPYVMGDKDLYDLLFPLYIQSVKYPSEKDIHEKNIDKILLYAYYFWDKKSINFLSTKEANLKIGHYLTSMFKLFVSTTYKKIIHDQTKPSL